MPRRWRTRRDFRFQRPGLRLNPSVSRESRITVLHYTGSRRDDGGVHAVIRQLARNPATDAVLGIAADYVPTKEPVLPVWHSPVVADEQIGPGNLWPTFRAAWKIRGWLRSEPRRVFHGH